MKKFCGFYTILSTMMILIITQNAGAFFTGYGQPGIKANDPFVKASTTLSYQVPEGFTKTEWEKISASIEKDRYRVQKDDRSGAYQAPNNAHDLHATFTREGFEVSPRNGKKAWNWGLNLTRYGYGSDLHAVPVAEKMITRDNRIEYHRGDMVEWYINDYRGIEQGFTLKARPSGRKGSDPLQLQMTTTTNLIPVVEKEGKGIIFRDAHGKEVLRYSGLYAYDDAGKDLGARMAADREGIRLIVEDHKAIYPITIDPFIERKKLLASDGAASDSFGISVSISGDTVIVGAHGDESGSAYIFSRDQGGADNWGQVKKLTAGDGAADDGFDDGFGAGVSISGNTAIVGAYWDDDNGTDSGSAYIFTRDHGGADNWGEVKKLLASDGAAYDYFGSVSISGDTAIVGAEGDNDNGDGSGSVYIFSRDQGGADNWGEFKKLTAGDGATGDRFGVSVSISGNTAIVGANWDDDNGDRSGSAYILFRDHGGADNWGQVKKLTAGDAGAYDNFGFPVSINGDTVIVGAPGDDDNGDDSGSAYIFSHNQGGANNWGEVKKLIADDGATGDYFGHGVSISGDTAIVGARFDDDNGDDSGSVYIFSRDQGGANNWGEVKKLTAGDGMAHDDFGYSVSISGDTTIVGAITDDVNGFYSGSAYIFSRNQGGADNWGEVKKLIPNDGTNHDLFGISVSISVDTAIVGAQYDDDNGTDSGSAYVYYRDYGGADNWGQVNKLTAGDGASSDYFGCSVSISGDTVIVGALGDDDNGSDSGSAYIFSYIFGDELAVDFGSNGMWHYSGTTWTHLAAWNPDLMLEWNGGLAVNFGAANGLWNYAGSTWTHLAAWEAEYGIACKSGLAVDFGLNGLWYSEGTTWIHLAAWDPDDSMVEWTGGLAVDFGAIYGLWNYNGTTWNQLAGWNPDDMVNWTNGIAVDFGPNGLWSYDGSSWTSLASWDPDDGIVEWAGGLAVDFGAIYGLWNYNGTSWNQLAGWNPEDDMVSWTDGLAVDFGSNGLWSYDGSSWTNLAGWNPEEMEGWANGLSVDFGATYGLWNYDGSSWTNIAAWDPEDIIDVDLY